MGRGFARMRWSESSSAFTPTGRIKQTGNIAGVLLHEGRPFANLRITVPAQIGKNQPVARIERLCHRIPEFVMTRKGMEKNDRRAAPPNFIKDFDVVAAHPLHGRRL